MYKYFTDIIKECKQERSFAKWLESVAAKSKELAYENRRTIYKSDVQDEIDRIKTFANAYKQLKALIKKGKVTDVIIRMDRKGYIKFTLVFPISQEEFNQAREYRRKKIKEIGQYGDLCVDFDSCVWELCKARVHKMLPNFNMCDCPSYPYYPQWGSEPLSRQIDIHRVIKKS